MGTRYGSGSLRGRKVTGLDEPLYEPIEKIDLDRARTLSASFGQKGKEAESRRAFQVLMRASRGERGVQQRHLQARSLNDIDSSERGGLTRAGRKRGFTRSNIDREIFARSDTGRAGYNNPFPKRNVGKAFIPMSTLKAGAKTAGFNAKVAGTLAKPKIAQGFKAATATPERALTTGAVGGALVATGVSRPKQPAFPGQFGKARTYDTEGRRQRRIGMTETGMLGAGGVLAFRGGRGIKRSTSAARAITGVTTRGNHGAELKEGVQRGLVARRRDLAEAAGGATLIGAAGGVHAWANGNKGRTYR